MTTTSFEHAIVGGGLIGLLCARELAIAGQSVVVIDKGQCGHESSWAGGGILSPLYPWRYPDAVNHLAKWSQQHYQSFCQTLLSETGIDPEWTRSGILLLDANEQDNATRWAQEYGTSTKVFDDSEFKAIEPSLDDGISSKAILFDDVAQVRNPRLLASLKASVLQLGVELKEGCLVQAFDTGSKSVNVLKTSQGEIRAGQYLLASGAWSGELARSLNLSLPIKPVKGQMLLYRAAPGYLKHILMHQGHYLIPRRDGRILVGSTLEDAGFDKQSTDHARKELESVALTMLPDLASFDIEAHWAGLRPGSANNGIPYIGRHPIYENIYVNSGHFRNGVVLGLASARLFLDLILDQKPILDPLAYRLLD